MFDDAPNMLAQVDGVTCLVSILQLIHTSILRSWKLRSITRTLNSSSKLLCGYLDGACGVVWVLGFVIGMKKKKTKK